MIMGMVDYAARDKVSRKDPDSYKNIVSKRSIFFEQGGTSPADVGSYFRFYRYLLKYDSKNIIGSKMWYFYRIFIPLYLISSIWLLGIFVVFIGNA